MTQVVVPVRYPLTDKSRATLSDGIDAAREREASLTVLHVNVYQSGRKVSRAQLKAAVEREFGGVPDCRYVVRSGLLVEETILDEVAAQDADVVVIGKEQASRWRSALRRVAGHADVERYLRQELDCEVVTVAAE